jgi:spermidine/putrescine transport system permease protein
VKIYSAARSSPTPAVNAAATVMLLTTLGAIALAWFVYRRITGSRGESMSAAGLAEL